LIYLPRTFSLSSESLEPTILSEKLELHLRMGMNLSVLCLGIGA
jgi:hypothetical protein